jgi:hypothetical protein
LISFRANRPHLGRGPGGTEDRKAKEEYEFNKASDSRSDQIAGSESKQPHAINRLIGSRLQEANRPEAQRNRQKRQPTRAYQGQAAKIADKAAT